MNVRLWNCLKGVGKGKEIEKEREVSEKKKDEKEEKKRGGNLKRKIPVGWSPKSRI